MKKPEALNPALDPSTDNQNVWVYPGDESTPEGSSYWYRLYLAVRAEQLDRAAQAASGASANQGTNFETGFAHGSLPLPDFMQTAELDPVVHTGHM